MGCLYDSVCMRQHLSECTGLHVGAGVMDPDQSHEIDMEEWLEFMLATDQELEQTAMVSSISTKAMFETVSPEVAFLCARTQDASKIAQKANADKGTTMSVLLGESADVFFGDKVGESTGGLAGALSLTRLDDPLYIHNARLFLGNIWRVRKLCFTFIYMKCTLNVLCEFRFVCRDKPKRQ